MDSFVNSKKLGVTSFPGCYFMESMIKVQDFYASISNWRPAIDDIGASNSYFKNEIAHQFTSHLENPKLMEVLKLCARLETEYEDVGVLMPNERKKNNPENIREKADYLENSNFKTLQLRSLEKLTSLAAAYSAITMRYLLLKDDESHKKYLVKAAETFGKFERLSHEIGNAFIRDALSAHIFSKRVILKKKIGAALGGSKKGQNSLALAKRLWQRYKDLPEYEELSKKYKRARMKLGDKLFEIFETEMIDGEIRSINQSRSWFYSNLVLPGLLGKLD